MSSSSLRLVPLLRQSTPDLFHCSNRSMTSLSAILSNSLDLDKTLENPAKESAARTASSILLEERQRSKQLLEQLDFIPVTNVKTRSDPLLDQISSSSIGAPTYWKDAATDKGTKVKPTLITMSGLPATSISKKKQDQRKKGEDYKDKHLERQASRSHRKDRIERMKKLY